MSGRPSFSDPQIPRLFSGRLLDLYDATPSEVVVESSFGLSMLDRDYADAMVVFIDGCCFRNGKSDASGGYGVYFGQNSKYNVSSPLKGYPRHTNQRAELAACLVALNQIERINNNEVSPEGYPWIMITDSAYLVNSLTRYVYKWRGNDYTAATGYAVANRDLFELIDTKLDKMALGRQRIDVVFWKVDRSDNEAADYLARQGAC